MKMEVDQKDVSTILKKYLFKVKEKNAAFSMRSLARKVDMNSGAVSQIISGKRKISIDLAQRFAAALEMGPEDQEQFFRPFRVETELKREKVYSLYNHNTFLPEQNWIVFSILNYTLLSHADSNVTNIASALGIAPEIINDIVNKMLECELLTIDKSGNFRRTANRLSTSDNNSDEAIRLIHAQNLRLAEKSLTVDDIGVRDFTSMTFAIDSSKLELAKKLIRKFEDDLACLLSAGNKDAVYKLNVQLFPTIPAKDAK